MASSRSYLVFAAFYFAQFGILGAYLPYFPLYLESLKLSGPQIGVVMALFPASRFLFPAFWGLWADRVGHRKLVILISLIGSAVSFSLLWQATTFLTIGTVIFLYGFLLVPALPLVEATVQEETEKREFTYGRVRLWGSVGFITMSLVLGRLLDRYPARLVLWAILLLGLLSIIPGIGLPKPQAPVRGPRPDLGGEIRWLEVIFFLSATTLMQASHGTYYVYYSIHLERLSYSRTGIGAFWTLAVAAEVMMMLASGRLLSRFRAPRLLIFCLVLAAFRWLVLSLFTSSAALLLAQILHAVTFGLFHVAAVVHTHRLFPENLRSSGQSLYSAMTYGLGSLIGFFGAAALLDHLSIRGLFGLSSAVALLAVAIAWPLYRIK